MPEYTKQDLNKALNNIRNSKSIRQASRDWGVPDTTLRNRKKGGEGHLIAAQSQQRLSPSQEEHLSNWVLAQEALGVPLSHGQIRQFVIRVLKIKGDSKPLGKR